MPDETETETQSAYSIWDQPPALGRRGMILAVVIPVLIAAAGFGVVTLISEGSDTAATTIKVPTGDWIPGQPTGSESIQGTLAVNAQRCVYLKNPSGEIWPVWPAGFRARLDSAGKVSLYDGKDHLVARDGEGVQARGIFTTPDNFSGETCLPAEDEVAVVQSEVTRVG
ncbi:hypothetical protein GCM10009795_007080 [Nocardioides hankookensis]|uniref:Uncharacterized protein n=1 Tax=Nocardioides hankookensis TaxID=443157 RepID=A0ABW1LHQ2_9ACTN